jgi:hypothetical protein
MKSDRRSLFIVFFAFSPRSLFVPHRGSAAFGALRPKPFVCLSKRFSNHKYSRVVFNEADRELFLRILALVIKYAAPRN